MLKKLFRFLTKKVLAENIRICPFCSGDVLAVRQSREGFYLTCENCFARSREAATISLAINQWNIVVYEQKRMASVES
ncbi:MAG: hypothetical protein RLZZ74_3410 [Cyanobacteriota bacterium]|jgi:hypothetical protein